MKKINQFAVIISLFTALLFFAGSRSALADENTITTVHIGTDIFTVFENGEIKAEKSDTIISDGLKADILGMASAQGPDKPTVPNEEATEIPSDPPKETPKQETPDPKVIQIDSNGPKTPINETPSIETPVPNTTEKPLIPIKETPKQEIPDPKSTQTVIEKPIVMQDNTPKSNPSSSKKEQEQVVKPISQKKEQTELNQYAPTANKTQEINLLKATKQVSPTTNQNKSLTILPKMGETPNSFNWKLGLFMTIAALCGIVYNKIYYRKKS
ncbi:hypothetical protein [Enterococcus crotali]|uniref:hypothetical protein n=1 Tax=Enterococcus crotali TaxID=1453587 RepID=UPI000471BEFE|nr:hypothetical protein [Enterococcus crotali]